MSERKRLLNMLRVMWRNGNSPLRQIYSSWEDLEANLEIKGDAEIEEVAAIKICPYCHNKIRILKPLDELFPFGTCELCNHSVHVSSNLSVRKLTEEEEEEMPEEWVRITEDLGKKKLAVVFRLE